MAEMEAAATTTDREVAVLSEISMSVVTEQWQRTEQQSHRFLRWPWRRDSSAEYERLLNEASGIVPSTKDRLHFLREHVNVEPVIFLNLSAWGLWGAIYPLFLFWARCVEMFDQIQRNDNSTTNATAFCAQIASFPDHHRALDMVETDVAQNSIYLQLFSALPALVSAPIFGAWSDYHGRRPPFILCQLGSFFYFALQCAASFLYPGSNVYAFLVPAELLFGLFAGIMAFTMASTIVVDQSRAEMAESPSGIPSRIAIACAIQFFGLFFGSSLATALLSSVSPSEPARHANVYSAGLLLAATFSGLGLLYSQCCVRETHFPGETGDNGDGPQLAFRHHVRHYTVDAFSVLAKKREGWSRLCLSLTVAFMFVEFMTMDSSLLFLVLKQFNWTDADFSILLQVRVFLNSVGTVALPLLLRLVPHWPGAESLLVMVSIAALGLCSALLAFARSKTQFFALSVFSLLSAGISPGFRTILARCVPKAETGRLFALVTLVMVLCPLASKSVLNSFYWATMKSWPGMVFLLVAIVHAFILMGQIILHFLMLPQWKAPSSSAEQLMSQNNGAESEADSTSSPGDSERSMVGSTTGEEEE